MDEEYQNEISENIEDLPQEVQAFIFGEDMNIVKKELVSQLQDQHMADELSMYIELFIFGEKDIEDVEEKIDSFAVDEIKKNAVKRLIQEKIIDELVLLVEARQELDQEQQAAPRAQESSPAPINVLASLKNRLTQPGSIAPLIRPQQSANNQSAPAASPQPPHTDLYREQV